MPHIHEKIDFTVEVFIIYGNKVLIRKHDKYGKWLGVGGHIELNEDPVQAAIREVKEEVGLDIIIIDEPLPLARKTINYQLIAPPRFIDRHRINELHEHVALVYFAKADTDKVVAGGEDKSEEWMWLTEEELNKNEYGIEENIVFFAKQTLLASKT